MSLIKIRRVLENVGLVWWGMVSSRGGVLLQNKLPVARDLSSGLLNSSFDDRNESEACRDTVRLCELHVCGGD
jgi:hypothetical protein